MKRSPSARRAYRKRRLEEYFGEQEQFEHVLAISAMPFFFRGRLFSHSDR